MAYRQACILAAILAGQTGTAAAADVLPSIEETVVTGVRMTTPLTLTTDPRAPRQPLPAEDGADYLKTIPGFSVIRKGGTNGDPVLRGMAGSRLALLLDGQTILGGCSNRMDPPTAYIFPDAFDRITVIKGPQSVQYGPGNSAGVVLFERDDSSGPRGWHVFGSGVAGSFGRDDEVVDAIWRGPTITLRTGATRARQLDYEDGDGVQVHSAYARWTSHVAITWAPDAKTELVVRAMRGNGEAAYADRNVDGSRFARESAGVRLQLSDLSPLIEQLSISAYGNYADHVMDDYSLRGRAGDSDHLVAMNPDRVTTGARVAATLPGIAGDLIVGIDGQRNRHSSRSSMNQLMQPYQQKPRMSDAFFEQVGLFAEMDRDVGSAGRMTAGARIDRWRVTDRRATIPLGMMAAAANPTRDRTRREHLRSGFVRFEVRPDAAHTTWFAGVGRSTRFPDYWEMIAKESATSLSALDIAAERTTQFDIGAIRHRDAFSGSLSLFANRIDDFLLIESGYVKPAMGASRTTTIVRNVDARSWGIEFDGQYRFAPAWRAEISIASVRGANDSDGRTLPQLPPVEARLGIYYDRGSASAGLLWRSLAAQDRIDAGRGNIVGQDFATAPAANIVSLNGAYRLSKQLSLAAGIDNLLNRTYAEAISRAGATIAGFDQLRRVNEPGRTAWLRIQFEL